MTEHRFDTSTRLSLALLIMVSVFAGGMTIARAADRPTPTILGTADELARRADESAELAAVLERFDIYYTEESDEHAYRRLEWDRRARSSMPCPA